MKQSTSATGPSGEGTFCRCPFSMHKTVFSCIEILMIQEYL